MVELKLDKNELNIYVDAKVRVVKLQPFISNSLSEISYPLSGNLSGSAFLLNDTNKTAVKFEIKDNVVLFSLSSAFASLSSDDCIGLLIDSLPGYKIGTSFYKYGNVKAWTHPVEVRSIHDLNELDNQFYLWKYNDGLYAAMMPLQGEGFVGQLGKHDGKLASLSYGLKSSLKINNVPLFAIAFGKDPYQVTEKLYQEGLTFINKPASLRSNKKFPVFFEKIMWCTWNSLGHDVSEKSILEAMDQFKKKDIKISLVLIDDGWSNVTEYGKGQLKSFEPNATKFPNGLKFLVDKLKNEYGVKEVGVWHTSNGYWAGIDPNSSFADRYREDLLKYQDKVSWSNEPKSDFYFVNPMSKSGFAFYDDWYTYLKNEGISFVKVDNQLIADRLAKNNFPFSDLAQKMQENLQFAINKHFQGHVLNCMDMTTDAVYNFGMSPLGRSSEDFFPENNSYHIEAGNAAVHVKCNALNSWWWSQMVWPDFDMFQTHHQNAEYHAIARALSGGPIYISDCIGMSDNNVLKKLMLENGSILRADQPALPTEDCLFSMNEAKPFKIFSFSNNVGLLGVFNLIDSDSVQGFISPSNIHGIEGKNFAVFDFHYQKIFKASLNDQIPISLSRLESKLYVLKSIKFKFASIGLINKYNSPKTIKKEIVQDKLALIELYENGIFAAYSEKKPLKVVTENDVKLNYTFENNLLLIHLPKGATKIGIQF